MMARMAVPDERTCPNCGNALRPYAVPRSLTPSRFLAADLLLWATVALFLAFLWAPRGEGELYAVLGAVALVVWALLRSRQRADRREFAARGRYRCDQCDLDFAGEELREIAPPSAPRDD